LSQAEKHQLLRVLNQSSPETVLDNPLLPKRSMFRASEAVVLDAVMPRYLLLRKDRLRAAYAKLGQKETYVNVSFHIHHDHLQTQSWWELKEREGPEPADPCFEVLRESVLGPRQRAVLSIVTYNERVSDSLFGKVFSNYGIIGMYAAYIFLANRLLRTIYSNISYVIRLEELPHVDRILNLCNEIYLVRENNLLRLEEQLVAKLFFLYRSSETMIKWTRHPKHIIDKFTDNPESQGNSSRLSLPPPPPPPPAPAASDLGPEVDLGLAGDLTHAPDLRSLHVRVFDGTRLMRRMNRRETKLVVDPGEVFGTRDREAKMQIFTLCHLADE
uniref:Piezo_RRas_bdg domain-containing protein n=1 Tax=Echinostoma caproni TaxID=27848 RepID=A0A183AAC9_9TREM